MLELGNPPVQLALSTFGGTSVLWDWELGRSDLNKVVIKSKLCCWGMLVLGGAEIGRLVIQYLHAPP